MKILLSMLCLLGVSSSFGSFLPTDADEKYCTAILDQNKCQSYEAQMKHCYWSDGKCQFDFG